MALPASNFQQQPLDIARLVMGNLDPRDMAIYRTAVPTVNRVAVQEANKQLLTLQKEQWAMILPNFSQDALANEAALRELDVATLTDLTEEERKAWVVAFNSLHYPPPPLSDADRVELLLTHFPWVYKRPTAVVPQHANNPDFMAGLDPRVTAVYEESTAREKYYRIHHVLENNAIRSPSQVAAYAGDFLTFLRLFAVDANRFSNRDGVPPGDLHWILTEHRLPADSNPTAIIERARRIGTSRSAMFPSNSLDDPLRAKLAAVLSIRGDPHQPGPGGLIQLGGLLRFPALVKAALLTGDEMLGPYTNCLAVPLYNLSRHNSQDQKCIRKSLQLLLDSLPARLSEEQIRQFRIGFHRGPGKEYLKLDLIDSFLLQHPELSA